MSVLVIAVKNDSFLGTMTAGSGNPDFLWSQPLPQVSPVLLVPQSCLKVQWLGHNRCPISCCVLNFMGFDSSIDMGRGDQSRFFCVDIALFHGHPTYE